MNDIIFTISFGIAIMGIAWLPVIYIKNDKRKIKNKWYKNEISKIDKSNCYDCKCKYCELKKYFDKENKR